MFLVLWQKGGYTKILMQKIGISTEQEDQTKRADYWAVKSWESCLQKLDIDVDVAFFGDSITRGGDFQDYFTNVKCINLGYSGDSLTGMQNRIGMLSAVSPEKTFIMGGINGLQGRPINLSIEEYESLLTCIQKELPYSEIYVQSILPVNSSLNENSNEKIRETNVQLEQLCNKMNIKYIDLYEKYDQNGEGLPKEWTKDGIHLQDSAYIYWYDEISKYIE